MKLLILKNESVIFDGEAASVTIETDNGQAEILTGHQPYMARIHTVLTYNAVASDNNIFNTINFASGFLYTNGDQTCAVIED